ncbi:MAG TPA: putative DNA modification/repair radical SAM protein [Acidobacteriaceae bacterium]|nr:putative DNA modification/repair radical SAM protein [Acidobacteriaceae bacterium]
MASLTVQQKLEILADAAKYDASCASSGAKRAGNGKGVGHSDGSGICHSYTPDGRCVSLLKILLTNFCTYDCVFCVNRVSSDIRRARFTPDEVVNLTLDFYKRNYIEGLFLSSGIIQSPDYTMEQLIAVAKTLRSVHHFGGYIHLKTIPGCDGKLIEEAGRWADRLSANIELPTQNDLVQLAPEKKAAVIETTMSQIQAKKDEVDDARKHTRLNVDKAPKFAPAGQSTQLVVGATPTSDREIIARADHLYGTYKLRRVYYTGFSPYPLADARLPLKPTPLIREHRLYQADWLMRFYGFEATELTSDAQPELSLTEDPKTAWAKRHPEFFPVDVNTAPREALLRIPGIGYKNVDRILRIRRYQKLALEHLRKLHVQLKNASPYITTTDHLPRTSPLTTSPEPPTAIQPASAPTQLDLFAASSALTGQV